jgi:chromosome segregation ATPase
LINYWNSHKQILEEKIRRLTNEINQLKKYKNADIQISQYNENILQAKREMNKLQMEITNQNTTIYNLYKKIECLEQALMISKQRTNAQLNEIEVN